MMTLLGFWVATCTYRGPIIVSNGVDLVYCHQAIMLMLFCLLPCPALADAHQHEQCLSTIREGRKRLTKADFEALAMIGRGAFGEVRLVRKRDTGEVRQRQKKKKNENRASYVGRIIWHMMSIAY